MSLHKSAVLLCLLVVFAINIAKLNSRPVTIDDLDSIKHLYGLSLKDSFSLPQTIQSVAKLSPEHAPGYALILNIWRRIVGEDMFQARLASVYFALLGVALSYRLALLTRDRRAALAAPFILALFAFLQYYSQIARVYSLLPLASGWVLWSYWRLLNAPKSTRWMWLSLFASVAGILYLHYVGALLLASVAIYHLAFAKKDRRWLLIVAVVAMACLLFTPWLPVALRGFSRSQSSLAKSLLSLPEALAALSRIYANGLWVLPLAASALLIINRRRLTDGERFLAATAMTLFALILLVNEVSPILVARRMRYTLILTLPLSCAYAIALCRLPGWQALRLPFLVAWLVASLAYAGSEDLEVFSNRRSLDLEKVPHYQDFIYESAKLPGFNEPILSFLPDHSSAINMALPYYRHQLSDWEHVLNMSRDEQGRLLIESSLSTYASPEAIASNSQGIWLIHNPALTNESELESDFAWFTRLFRFCKRFVEKPESIIDYYLKPSIPCELVTDEQPFAIRYDNGAELGNLATDLQSESLALYLRWRQAIDKDYAFTLQIFDSDGSKVGQFDKVISGDPIDIAEFDLSSLSAGEHVVRLIVYHRETLASQPGELESGPQAFERSVDVVRFTVHA